MKNTERDFERHAKALGRIAIRDKMPFILAMQTTKDGEMLRTSFGSIDDTVLLLAIMLVQLQRQTGEPLNDLLTFFNLQVKFASDAYSDRM